MEPWIKSAGGKQVVLATGQTTVYAPKDDGDERRGTAKSYTVGTEAGSTTIDVPTFASASVTFTAASRLITAASGLDVVKTADTITCPGSPLNPGPFLVQTGNVAGEILIDASTPIVDETGDAAVVVTFCKRTTQTNVTVEDDNIVVNGVKRMWQQVTTSGMKIGAASDGKLVWYAAAQAFTVYSSANTISCTGPNLIKIVGGAGLVGNFHVGHCYQFTGFATTMNNLTGGWPCTAVAVNGADLDLTFSTSDNAFLTTEGAVGDTIAVVCNSVFAYCAACNAASLSDRTDWRISNRNELGSILDFETPNGLPDGVAFPGFGGYQWTSTTKVDAPTFAYRPYPFEGIVTGEVKTNALVRVILVRGP